MPNKPLSIGFGVTFHEAIKAAQNRGIVLPDVYYGELQGLARQLAFSIAGIAAHDQLKHVKDTLLDALQNGMSFSRWKKDILESGALDLPEHRLDNIFRTNIQNSYNRGRWEKLQSVKDRRPYLMYDAINDSRVRPTHLAMDGIIRPADDQFWQTHAPSNGYRCRCRLISLSEKQAQRRSGVNKGLNKQINYDDMKPDKGWDYNPGADLKEGVKRAVKSKPESVLKASLNNKAKEKKYWDDGTEQSKWHIYSFEHSPEFVKNAVKKYDKKLRHVSYKEKKGSYYRPSDVTINMAERYVKNKHDNISTGTWMHEYGHFLDHQMAKEKFRSRSIEDDYTNAMNSDANKIIYSSGLGKKSKEVIGKIRKSQSKIISELKELDADNRRKYIDDLAKNIGLSYDDIKNVFSVSAKIDIGNELDDIRAALLTQSIIDNDAASFVGALKFRMDAKNLKEMNKIMQGDFGIFSDLVGSATKNKLLGMGKINGFSGHSTSYYSRHDGAQQSEAFANMTALLGRNMKAWDKILNIFFPDLTKLHIDILKNE